MRTRFAPSPTGYLHIGGVRTALFNWLLARRHGGCFVLRIEDTDTERNKPEALQPILDGFRWLGLDWDEGPDVGGPHGPYFQSQRFPLYAKAALALIESGHAYPDYTQKPDLDAQREAAQKAKRAFVYRGPNRDAGPTANADAYRANPQCVLRLRVPDGETVVVDDIIRGRVEVQADTIGDSVILREPDADGTARPIYNFAAVVDDAAMKITHVVRAAEHLSNTPVQVLIYRALGYDLPAFAHVPVVNEPGSKKKLSKRDMAKFVTEEVKAKLRVVGYTDADIAERMDLNPATVAFYRELGYLPAALVNYLSRLGWSLDDKTEIMALETMVQNFALERVTNAAASFDPAKLYWMAGEYMKALPLNDRVAGTIPFVQKAGLVGDPADDATKLKLFRILEASGDRIKLFSDALFYAAPFLRPDVEYDPAAVAKALDKPGAMGLLVAFRDALTAVEPFDHASIEAAMKAFCEAQGIKLGGIVHAVRVAVTGSEVGPGVYDCLTLLGKDESLRRLGLAIGRGQSA